MSGFPMRQTVVARIEEVAQKAAVTDGLEVVEVELKGSGNSQMLRIYIDKSPGVTHADCELISRHVSEFLDSEDLLPGHYTLEVSSPGVERKRRKLQDLEGFQGQRAKVVLREPLEDVRRFEGVLQAAQDGAFKMELGGGRSVQFPFEQIDRAYFPQRRGRLENRYLKFEW